MTCRQGSSYREFADMHEFSIAENIVNLLEEVLNENNGKRVTKFTLEIGEFSNVVPEVLISAFEVLKTYKDFIKDSEVEMRSVPLLLKCNSCRETFKSREFVLICPFCQSYDVDAVDGTRIILREVIIEAEEI